jgi:DNA-directed RNA polymerase specialized sigma subunit
MNAKEYLRQGRFLDTQINSKIQQVESLHGLATKATSTLSDMPGSPTRNTHRMEDIIIKILMLENEINEDIAKLVDLKNEILGVIKAVDDEELRIVLEKRYLNYEQWSDIADDLCLGVDSVYKLHQKALKKVKVPKTLQ